MSGYQWMFPEVLLRSLKYNECRRMLRTAMEVAEIPKAIKAQQ